MKRASVTLGLGLVMSMAAASAMAAGVGDAAAGKAVAASCAACHGAEGKAPIQASYPKLAGQNAEYLAAQLKAFRDGSRGGANAVLMQPMAAGLTDADINNLAAYFAGVE